MLSKRPVLRITGAFFLAKLFLYRIWCDHVFISVDIEGEGMVAILLRRLFLPFEDNEVLIQSNASNIGKEAVFSITFEFFLKN